MEHEPIKISNSDLDLEEGEVSDSDDAYTPLPRPDALSKDFINVPNTATQMDDTSDQDDLNYKSNSDSSDSDEFINMTRKKRSDSFSLRAKPMELLLKPQTVTNPKSSKYNIWSASLQEDSLLENMRGCDVTQSDMRNRDVESYDYSIKYRLNGESSIANPLKRRQSNSDDSDHYNRFDSNKRFRASSNDKFNNHSKARKSVKLRLGTRSDDSNSNDSSYQNAPRYILDLNTNVDSEEDDVAREIANKLCETKDDLLLRVVSVLGKDLPIKLFKETQKIESDGGMLIMNGERRRTPGGVFLFLLKHNEEVSKEDKKRIFLEDSKKALKDRKHSQALNREKKVEELKKTLNRQAVDNELPVIPSRKELMMSHLKPEMHSTLSNPPPSPVTDVNRESSPEYETQNIVHVNVTSPEKATSKDSEAINAYEDDFLDMHCDDMDLF